MLTTLISVIVVCRNPGPRLREALASVWAQQDVAVDLVVIDGASTDGAAEWLRTEQGRLARLVSEPDRGVYDAMNKGVSLAKGEWILFLGADDRLMGPTVLKDASATLQSTPASIVVGAACYEDGRRYVFSDASPAIRRNFMHHQAAFYRRNVFGDQGHFDITLRYQADYDFNLRLLRAGLVFSPLALTLSTCGTGGLSDAGHWANYREEIVIRHRHFPAWKCWLWDGGSLLRFARKNIISRRTHG